MSMSLSVLCPTGHRVNIKVTRTTTLLSVLEDACSKRRIENPSGHVLRHHQKRLDLSLTVGFSGLPNKAQLELVALDENDQGLLSRNDDDVTVVVQLEDGTRLEESKFRSEITTLFDLFNRYKLFQNDENALKDQEPVFLYMRKEVIGVEDFSKTTLKQMGIFRGTKALLRFFYKVPSSLKEQAGVYNVVVNSKESSSVRPWVPMRLDRDSESIFDKMKKGNQETERRQQQQEEENMDVDDESPSCSNDGQTTTKSVEKTSKDQSHTPESEQPTSSEEKESTPQKHSSGIDGEGTEEGTEEEEKIVIYLDEEKTVLAFDYANVSLSPSSKGIASSNDLDDSFFEVSIRDLQIIQRDHALAVKRYEEGDALMIAEDRKRAEESQKLALLNKYKNTVLRVLFPDKLVLQFTCLSGSSVQDVQNKIRNYLEDSNCEFELFVTPPKKILKPQQTLLDAKLIPAALIHFSSSSGHYLKPDIRNKLSNYSGAESVFRGSKLTRNHGNKVIKRGSHLSSTSSSGSSTPGAKIPKWFKVGKK